MAKHPKRPRDPNQLAKAIVDLATGEANDPSPPEGTASSKAARRGGLKGGDARARALTPERRAEIAKAAAKSRWKTDRPVRARKEPV